MKALLLGWRVVLDWRIVLVCAVAAVAVIWNPWHFFWAAPAVFLLVLRLMRMQHAGRRAAAPSQTINSASVVMRLRDLEALRASHQIDDATYFLRREELIAGGETRGASPPHSPGCPSVAEHDRCEREH